MSRGVALMQDRLIRILTASLFLLALIDDPHLDPAPFGANSIDQILTAKE
jgi:hypothetical protein